MSAQHKVHRCWKSSGRDSTSRALDSEGSLTAVITKRKPWQMEEDAKKEDQKVSTATQSNTLKAFKKIHNF